MGGSLATNPSRNGAATPRSVLIVERKAAVARKIRRSLIRLGYHVPATARSATEALAAVEAHRPNVIVMDLDLEGSDEGIETATAIQARHPTPIVFLTEGSADAALMRAQEHAQPLGFVVKPYQDLELRAAVEVALVRHGLAQEIDRQRSLFAGILGGMSDAVAAADAQGNIVLANEARRAGFGEQSTIASKGGTYPRRRALRPLGWASRGEMVQRERRASARFSGLLVRRGGSGPRHHADSC
jgi:CheY-like chemotaxis protein